MITEGNNSYVPKYIQIENYILQKIKENAFKIGDKIPSEAALSSQFHVSRITVNAAIKELASSGVVERIQGKGTFVRAVDDASANQPMGFASGISIVPHEKASAKPHKLLEHGMIKADAILASKLNLQQGDPVYKLLRSVGKAESPTEIDYSYIPISVCNDHVFDCEELERIFLHDYIYKYFQLKPTHLKIFLNTSLTSDMDIRLLHKINKQELFTWDTYVYQENRVLAVTTTIDHAQANKPFITLAF